MSVVLQGWGVPFAPITSGYGAAAAVLSPGVLLRETFTAPTPAGETATRHAAHGAGAGAGAGEATPPYLGSLEHPISFGLDFHPWMGLSEALSSVAATVRAYPLEPELAPYDATSALLQTTQVQGSLAIVTLHGATAQTTYVITLSAQTTQSRTLECRMPRIWCPD